MLCTHTAVNGINHLTVCVSFLLPICILLSGEKSIKFMHSLTFICWNKYIPFQNFEKYSYYISFDFNMRILCLARISTNLTCTEWDMENAGEIGWADFRHVMRLVSQFLNCADFWLVAVGQWLLPVVSYSVMSGGWYIFIYTHPYSYS